MLPFLGQAKVDKILSQFSQAYRNKKYIAEDILPPLAVKERTGQFAKYGKENFRVNLDQIYRAPGTRAMGVDYSVSQGQYNCKERAVEKLVPDELKMNSDEPYMPLRDGTWVATDMILVNQEYALASALADAAILTLNTTLSGTSQWSDYTNSDPITDINTGIEAVRVATGQRPNTAWMGISVWYKLKMHPLIRENIKYTVGSQSGGQVTDMEMGAFLKALFNIDNVFVGEAVYNSALPGQTDVLADVWGKHFWLAYRTPSPTLMQATFGLTLQDVPTVVEMYREEQTRSDVVRVRKSFDQNIFDANLAYLIKNAIA